MKGAQTAWRAAAFGVLAAAVMQLPGAGRATMLGGGGREANPAALAFVDTMRNPAAVYCTSLGYEHEIVDGPDGAQSGVCRFGDGSECDEWDFLSGRCGGGHSACAAAGLKTVTVRESADGFSHESAICLDSQGRRVASAAGLTRLAERSGAQADVPGFSPAALAIPEEAQGSAREPADPPEFFDWRDHEGSDWTTPVKNQGICGSCWAFAAVGASEAAFDIASGDPDLNLDLAEQYLVADCMYGCCWGGNHGLALSFIRSDGIPDEACLPYLDGLPSGCSYSGTLECRADLCTYHEGSECSDYRCSDRCSDWAGRLRRLASYGSLGYFPSIETIQQALIDHGPLSSSMLVGSGSYDENGVYSCATNNSTNHAVVIVGYDEVGGYWIVRNSWGATWGPDHDGHFKVAYDTCGLQRTPYYAKAFYLIPTDWVHLPLVLRGAGS
jgi:putative hemolysin